VSFSLDEGGEEGVALSSSTPEGCCKCKRNARDDATFGNNFPTTSEEAEEEEETEQKGRRRVGSDGSGASSTSLSRFYCKSRSFSCLSDAFLGPHGDSAKSLEKSARPKKKRRQQQQQQQGNGSNVLFGDKEADDHESTTLSFKECRLDVANVAVTRSRFAQMKTGFAKNLPSPILLSNNSSKGGGEHIEGGGPLSPEQAASSFDELCKSFETEMFLQSPMSSGRSDGSCIDVT